MICSVKKLFRISFHISHDIVFHEAYYIFDEAYYVFHEAYYIFEGNKLDNFHIHRFSAIRNFFP